MIRGIELYNDYVKRLEATKNAAGEILKEKEAINQREILYYMNLKGTVSKVKIAIMLLIMVLLGPYYAIVKNSGLIFILFYFLGALLVYIGISIYEYYVKQHIKRLKEVDENDETKEIKAKLSKIQDEIIEITIFIICYNEYYYDLIRENKDTLKEKWQNITLLRRESIEKSMNNVVTWDKYFEYLKEWIDDETKRSKRTD